MLTCRDAEFLRGDIGDGYPCEPTPPSHRSTEPAARSLLAGALRRARWTIFWERLWPALATLATVVGLFLTVSWLGLWLWLPPLGRAAGMVVFALLALAALVPFARLRSRRRGCA